MRCPSGHETSEVDYCSVCGLALVAATGSAPSPTAGRAAAGSTATRCPACREPRQSLDARFCEVCRHDFEGAGKQAPIVTPPPARVATPLPTPTRVSVTATPTAAKLELVVVIDATLDLEPDAATPPPNDPVRTFPIDVPEMLIGRRDDTQQIHPQVPLHDPGASRRHARIVRAADGGVSLHDLASVNGTRLNGRDMISGSMLPLVEGDEVTLGRWTRLRIRARR